MANNVGIPIAPGGGQTISTEDIGGGIQLARTKITTGVSGTDGGDVSIANPLATSGVLRDGVTAANVATVASFHNADNQVLPANSYGLNTGGVAQLLNIAGNLDRSRETGIDSVPAAGVPAGTAQNAQPFSTSHAASTIAGAAIVFTPVAMTGFTSGAPWSIQVGSTVVLEPTPVNGPVPANQESVVVTAVSGTTFTAKAAKTHAGSFGVLGFVYNQSRDATVVDGAAGIGFGAAGTYLFNAQLNALSGGWERERSASGELDAASGVGTAVAAEYEWNGIAYDRARSLPAKSMTANTLSAAYAAGVTSIVLGSAPANLTPGEYLFITDTTGGPITDAPQVGPGYTPGSTTVPLVTALVAAHLVNAVVIYEGYNVNGPGLNGFFATGIGIEEEALWDPITAKYYIERAATADAMAPQNIVAESAALWNGATMDRMRSVSAVGDGLGVELSAQPASTAPAATVPAANTAAVTTFAAVASQQHRLTFLAVSYSAAPTGGRLTVADGGTNLIDMDITAAGPLVIPLPPGGIKGTVNTALTITLAAGSGAVVGKVSAAKLTA